MEPLDLVDIALLLNYERCASEPRFRHAKLREVAFPGEEPESLAIKAKFWSDDSRPRTVIVLDRPSQDREETSSEPDTPSNFLPKKLVPWDRLRGLESKRLETLYYQTRGHNACFTCVALIQHFFDLFEPETPIRVRHGPKGNAAGGSYHTPIERRNIVEMTMIRPKQTTISVVAPEGMTYVSGEEETMVHAVIGFARPGGSDIISFFDLSSMQFGDIGRGPGAKGQGLFALDTVSRII
ncbi:hypothetical protein F5B20DRAFT_489820 [Whalleya microplaca]|nr:hypothetical protein F5B20DRAFT_489820 [Whalleya microplaca]